jgi:hypothetical protein
MVNFNKVGVSLSGRLFKRSGSLLIVLLFSFAAVLLLVSCGNQSEIASESDMTKVAPTSDAAVQETTPTEEPTAVKPADTKESETNGTAEVTVGAVTPTTESIPTPEPTAEPSPEPVETEDGDELMKEIERVREEIEANVVEVRGLEPEDSVEVTLLDREELRERLEGELLEDFSKEEARDNAIVLSAFDFIPKDFDLYGFTVDLLTEEIAGFYDPETNEFVLINEDAEYDVLEKLTYAHEYVHALQDQHYDLDQLDEESLDSEASMALTALAEGDATLVQTLYLLEGYMSQAELMEALTKSMEVDTAVLDSAPPVLSRQMLFPYLEGASFVEALYARGGFDAVNQAWESPPESTEQILHPERYFAGDSPQIVSLAPLTDTLGSGWEMIDQDIMGELFIREYLVQQLEDRLVDIASTGWGGDQYAVYWNEADEDQVMVLRIAFDSPDDNEEFQEAYRGYPGGLLGAKSSKQRDGGLCWEGAEEVICLYSVNDETLIARAPNLSLASLVAAEQLRFFMSQQGI